MRIFQFRPWAVLGISLAILTVAGGGLYWHGSTQIAQFKSQQDAIMTHSAHGAAATISRELGRLQVATAFFAKRQSQLLADIAKHPQDENLRAELGRRINTVFNNVISFSLADEFGTLLLPNPHRRAREPAPRRPGASHSLFQYRQKVSSCRRGKSVFY